MSIVVSLVGSLGLLAVALIAPAMLVQTGFALCGERAPGLARALIATVVAGVVCLLVGGIYAISVGWLIALFSGWLSAGLQLVLALFTMAGVYRMLLHTSAGTAFKVVMIQWALSVPLSWLLWLLLRWIW